MQNVAHKKTERGVDDEDGADALLISYLIEAAGLERRLHGAAMILRAAVRDGFNASRRKRRTRSELIEHARAVKEALEHVRKIAGVKK